MYSGDFCFFDSTSLSKTSGNKHRCSKLSCNTFHSEEDYSDSSELHKTARITNANVTKCTCNSKWLYTKTVGFTDLFLKPFVPSRCLLLRPPCVLRPAGLAGGQLAPVWSCNRCWLSIHTFGEQWSHKLQEMGGRGETRFYTGIYVLRTLWGPIRFLD